MTTLLSDERAAFVDAIRDFARRECGTREQRDAATECGTDAHSPALYSRLAELGWIGASIPEEYGGVGGTIVDACLLMEETERGLVPIYGLGVSLIVAAAVEKYGTPAQRERVLREVVAGHTKAIAMSEPGAGSDVGALRTSARRDDDRWVIEGQKTWTSAAHHADEILVVCRTDRDAPKHRGLSMFLVPADAPGVTVRPIETMGAREVNDVFLADVVVPDDSLVGTENAAWPQLMAGLDFERLITSAAILGIAERAFDVALAFALEREQFGRPIGTFQTLRHRLADMATEIAATRALIYDIAHRIERSHVPLAREASMAKLKASETAKTVAIDGMQIMGGAGYASEYDMEHLVRRALPSTIYAGTNEIQREIIGGSLGLAEQNRSPGRALAGAGA